MKKHPVSQYLNSPKAEGENEVRRVINLKPKGLGFYSSNTMFAEAVALELGPHVKKTNQSRRR